MDLNVMLPSSPKKRQPKSNASPSSPHHHGGRPWAEGTLDTVYRSTISSVGNISLAGKVEPCKPITGTEVIPKGGMQVVESDYGAAFKAHPDHRASPPVRPALRVMNPEDIGKKFDGTTTYSEAFPPAEKSPAYKKAIPPYQFSPNHDAPFQGTTTSSDAFVKHPSSPPVTLKFAPKDSSVMTTDQYISDGKSLYGHDYSPPPPPAGAAVRSVPYEPPRDEEVSPSGTKFEAMSNYRENFTEPPSLGERVQTVKHPHGQISVYL